MKKNNYETFQNNQFSNPSDLSQNPTPLDIPNTFIRPVLSKLPDLEVLSRLERLVKSERKIMHLILWHVLEVDTRKLFLLRGYNSLYAYLNQHLGYSESSAYERMQAARVLKIVPEVSEKLEDGSLNLTQLVKVEKSIKQEKKLGKPVTLEKTKKLLSKLENKTGYETQKIIATEMNQAPVTNQKITPQKDGSVRIEFTLSAEQNEILKKAQNLHSHVIPDNNLADLITKLAKDSIQKVEGKKPKSEPKNKSQKEELNETQPMMPSFGLEPESESNQRKYIPAKVKRVLFQRAGHACEYVQPETNKRCDSCYQLQIDHIIPVAKGGTNEFHNLRALCGVHNRAEAERMGLHRP